MERDEIQSFRTFMLPNLMDEGLHPSLMGLHLIIGKEMFTRQIMGIDFLI
jgi:hypothetical protein